MLLVQPTAAALYLGDDLRFRARKAMILNLAL